MANVGPMEALVAVVLGVLALAALAALVVALMSGAAVALSPVFAACAAGLRRRAWRNWHPPTSWIPDPAELEPTDPADREQPAVRAASVVSSEQSGDLVRLVTVLARDHQPDSSPGSYTTTTMVHAKLGPTDRLELPPARARNILVYVLSGQGVICCTQRRPVSAGQTIVLEPGVPLSLLATPNGGSHSFEVLVLGRPPEKAWSGPVLVDPGGEVVRRINALKSLFGLPALDTERGSAPDAAAARVPGRRTTSTDVAPSGRGSGLMGAGLGAGRQRHVARKRWPQQRRLPSRSATDRRSPKARS